MRRLDAPCSLPLTATRRRHVAGHVAIAERNMLKRKKEILRDDPGDTTSPDCHSRIFGRCIWSRICPLWGGHCWGDGLEPTGGRRSCTCLRGRRQVLSDQWPVSRCTTDTNTTDSEASLPNALMSK